MSVCGWEAFRMFRSGREALRMFVCGREDLSDVREV